MPPPGTAGESVGNPARVEQLDILVSVLASSYRPGAAILDLGIGSGQVEARLFARLPEARVVGVDGSAAMLALARTRLAPVADRCVLIEHDFADIDRLGLPDHTRTGLFSAFRRCITLPIRSSAR